jgi:hypothetical protein
MGDYDVADVYAGLRDQVLHLKPGAGDVSATVIAVLMETGYPEAVATLVAVADGTVSLYFSNGGGVIGAGAHDGVRSVARTLLSSAETYVSRASETDSFPLPSKGHVRFYLVTTQGTFTIEAPESDLGLRRHEFSPLFHDAHALIAAIRKHARP